MVGGMRTSVIVTIGVEDLLAKKAGIAETSHSSRLDQLLRPCHQSTRGLSDRICTLAGVTMKARLDGHEFDLRNLADWLPSGNIRVAKDDVGYYLSAAVIDNPPEGKTFYEAAQDLLPIVNGIGSLKSAKFRPVKLDGRYQDGEKRHTVVGVGTIEVRSRVHAVGIVTGPDGKVKPQPPPPGIAYAGLTARPEVAEALTILATPAGGGSSCTRCTRSSATP
jgi:hypothetical protein